MNENYTNNNEMLIQYIDAESGKIVTSKWVTVGSKKYYCNKNGVVTKTKKVSKK